MSQYLYNPETNSIIVSPSNFESYAKIHRGARFMKRVKDMACWCKQPRNVGAAVTYDDWGNGPQCNLCGELKEE